MHTKIFKKHTYILHTCPMVSDFLLFLHFETKNKTFGI